MNAWGYIVGGLSCGALGVVLLAIAAADDDLQNSLAAAGGQPDTGFDTASAWIALILFVVAAVLVLIGVVSAGVRAGVKAQSDAGRETS